MSIDEMVSVVEKYLEDAGFENAKVKYLNSKSDDEIRVLYESIIQDCNKHI